MYICIYIYSVCVVWYDGKRAGSHIGIFTRSFIFNCKSKRSQHHRHHHHRRQHRHVLATTSMSSPSPSSLFSLSFHWFNTFQHQCPNSHTHSYALFTRLLNHATYVYIYISEEWRTAFAIEYSSHPSRSVSKVARLYLRSPLHHTYQCARRGGFYCQILISCLMVLLRFSARFQCESRVYFREVCTHHK